MKLSLSWLSKYVNYKLSVDDLIHRLTMAGLEVETIEQVEKDTVLDLEITPNRPDCLSTIGLAREIAAITGKSLVLPKIKTHASTKQKIAVTINDKKCCGRYIATLISNVSIQETATDIRTRLISLGMNPINNVVDVTNFVLMELGQPLHAFDYDKIIGGEIIVRFARQGEEIVTLDGVLRKLDPSILVIADSKRPIAIAGIMGGMDTAVTSNTKNILLESAHFDSVLVRRAGRMLGLKSDSSYRFERGVDIQGVLIAANRATDLIIESAGGKILRCTDVFLQKKSTAAPIGINVHDVDDLLGTKVSLSQIKSAFLKLGCKVSTSNKGLRVTPASFRSDLKIKEDLIEEIARVIGYDNLDTSFPLIKVNNIAMIDPSRAIRKRVSQCLISLGFCETITYTLISEQEIKQAGLEYQPGMALRNPLSQTHAILRPSLLPSLLNVVASNINRGQRDLKLFEIGKRYFSEGERWTLGIIMCGRRQQDWRSFSKVHVDFFDIKGVVERVLEDAGINAGFKKGQNNLSTDIFYQEKQIGQLLRVSPDVTNAWGIKNTEVFFAELEVQELLISGKNLLYQPIPEFPAIIRDISIAAPKNMPYADIQKACQNVGGDILKEIVLVEEYVGDKIPQGQRALVLSLIYQSKTKTLTDQEVNAVHQNLLNALKAIAQLTIR